MQFSFLLFLTPVLAIKTATHSKAPGRFGDVQKVVQPEPRDRPVLYNWRHDAGGYVQFPNKGEWKKDAHPSCAVCQEPLSQMMPGYRHHCRLCAEYVCEGCSQQQLKGAFVKNGRLELKGDEAVSKERACNDCVLKVFDAGQADMISGLELEHDPHAHEEFIPHHWFEAGDPEY